MEFKKVWEAHRKTTVSYTTVERWNVLYQQALVNIHTATFPRRKHTLEKAVLELPAKVIIKTKEQFEYWGKVELTHRRKQEKLLRNVMYSLSDVTTIIPITENRVVYSIPESNYRSQGWGAYKYAKDRADQYTAILIKNGISAYTYANKKTEYGYTSTSFDVMAPLEDWQFTCILMQTTESQLEWAINCWKRGVNPKVYDPFLPDSIFDESMNLWNKQ